jgi:hypothetical protein
LESAIWTTFSKARETLKSHYIFDGKGKLIDIIKHAQALPSPAISTLPTKLTADFIRAKDFLLLDSTSQALQ